MEQTLANDNNYTEDITAGVDDDRQDVIEASRAVSPMIKTVEFVTINYDLVTDDDDNDTNSEMSSSRWVQNYWKINWLRYNYEVANY